MTTLEEVRKSIEAVIGNLTPAKAQELAKSLSDPGTAKEQVSKLAADMLVWSQRSRDRLKEFVAREVSSQMNSMGVATQADLDSVKKRVRDLERRAGMTASGRRSSAKKSTAKKSTAQKSTAQKSTAQKSTARSRPRSRRRPHPRDRLRAPSAARRRARAPRAGEQSSRSAGRGGRGAGDGRREPGHEGRLAGRRRRPGAGDRTGVVATSRAEERSSGRPSTGSPSIPATATASTRERPRAGSPTASCRRARRGSWRSTWGTASSRGRSATTRASP